LPTRPRVEASSGRADVPRFIRTRPAEPCWSSPPAMNSPARPSVLLPHGGYRKLRSYKVAEVVYDATVVFCHFGGTVAEPRAARFL